MVSILWLIWLTQLTCKKTPHQFLCFLPHFQLAAGFVQQSKVRATTEGWTTHLPGNRHPLGRDTRLTREHLRPEKGERHKNCVIIDELSKPSLK
jgi:hypothetical protein